MPLDALIRGIDLDALDRTNAALPGLSPWTGDPAEPATNPEPEPAPPTKARSGTPARPRRVKGEKLDRSTDAYKADLAAAQRGLPPLHRLTWACAQLWDNGPEAKVRYKARLEFTDAEPRLCTRAGRREICRVRTVPFSTRKQFVRNLKRKKRERLSDYDWRILDMIFAQFETVDAESAAHGLEPTRFGMPQMVFDGTRTYLGQYAALSWRLDATTGEMVPVVTLLWNAFRARTDFDDAVIHLRTPEVKAGNTRSPRASGWVGSWCSERFQGLIDAAKATKAEKAQQAALAAKLKKGRA